MILDGEGLLAVEIQVVQLGLQKFTRLQTGSNQSRRLVTLLACSRIARTVVELKRITFDTKDLA